MQTTRSVLSESINIDMPELPRTAVLARLVDGRTERRFPLAEQLLEIYLKERAEEEGGA